MTFRTFSVALLLILTFALTGTAWAQQEKGDNELLLQGSLDLSFDDSDDSTGTVGLTWGKFFTDHQQAGIAVRGFLNGDGDIAGFGGPFWRYNFGGEKTVPFFGLAAETSFSDSEISDDFIVTIEAGSRWFLKRQLAFSLAGQTSYYVDSSEFDERLRVLFGFSYFWKK